MVSFSLLMCCLQDTHTQEDTQGRRLGFFEACVPDTRAHTCVHVLVLSF